MNKLAINDVSFLFDNIVIMCLSVFYPEGLEIGINLCKSGCYYL